MTLSSAEECCCAAGEEADIRVDKSRLVDHQEAIVQLLLAIGGVCDIRIASLTQSHGSCQGFQPAKAEIDPVLPSLA